MPAGQAVYLQRICLSGSAGGSNRQAHHVMNEAGAGYTHHIGVAAIHIQHPAGANRAHIQLADALHAVLLADGKEQLHRRVHHGVILHQRQHIHQSNCIVGAQCSVIGIQVVPIFDVQADGVCQKIMVGARFLGRNHVHMRLQQHGLLVLIPGRCVQVYHQVSRSILHIAMAVPLRAAADIRTQCLLMVRGMRNRTYFLKIAHNMGGLIALQDRHVRNSPLLTAYARTQ